MSLLIFSLILVLYFFPNGENNTDNFVELAEYQTQIDVLRVEANNKKKAYKLKPFNPNFITEYKAYVLGLSVNELNKLLEYRKKDKWINSKQDFKKVTGVSDSLLTVIAPLFKFPDWVNRSKNQTSYSRKKKFPEKSFAEKGDLNIVAAKELQETIGVPDFIAERIIARRVELNGFVSDIQLKDVKGLYNNKHNKILLLYTVKTPLQINKININKASVKQLMEVPYFDFETALEIKDFIEQNNGISDFEELGKIEGFSLEKIDRIALYLTLN
ncbi:helix-hairpin-helix domain-containing protein [Aquimarina litoralis]|uniref:helix-hairpin-helix domain-containing protein n=1 Tax=Aquimarina litoralis TaxID=584605 RepID=UPI001C59DBAB|nr:helix-hairpin-helix domain-containing protein [Aquimarina litoralis]